MFRIALSVTVLGLAAAAVAVELPEQWQKKVDAVDAAYFKALEKINAVRDNAAAKAQADRVAALRKIMIEANKVAELDVVADVKAKIDELGTLRAKPAKTFKLGGHEYALIDEKLTWHVAKKRCEEMGGHLVTIESAVENANLLQLCQQANVDVWIGATDEEVEGQWMWVTGQPVGVKFAVDNAGNESHHLSYFPGGRNWNDTLGGTRAWFICEWE